MTPSGVNSIGVSSGKDSAISLFFDLEFQSILREMRESAGPLDLRQRYLIARFSKLHRKTSALIKDLEDELQKQEKAPDCPAVPIGGVAGRVPLAMAL
ncbi:hypothetical protein ACFQ0M_16520 [Kitasatospora aburaviensis]